MITLALEIKGLDPDRLKPFEVDGVEELSRLYQFDVSCVDVAFGNLLGPEIIGRQATLTISLDDQLPRVVQGVIETVAVMAPVTYDHVVYRLRLSPGLCRLKESRHNHIFGTVAPVSVVDVLRSELNGDLRRGSSTDDGDRSALQYDLRLRDPYPSWDHLVQFQECDFDFISRLAEHYGIFYFFENTLSTERVVFTDYNLFAPKLDGETVLPYAPAPSEADRLGVLRTFEAVYAAVPSKVFLQDYNDEFPHTPLLVSEDVDPAGRGNWVEYGAHYRTLAEGAFLARVRAEAFRCLHVRFRGSGTVARLAPGRMFQMAHHPFRAWNQQYLVVSVRHRIKAATTSVADPAGSQHQGEYHNEFMAIPGDVPFRPERSTARPRIEGLVNGRVESRAASADPALDAAGRYCVRLPFDLAGTPGGFGSQWVRKLEPYGGPGNGMHFPLPPGTNVLVGFVNGDPDRPVIVGAVPAADNPSVVTSAARQLNRITTRSGIVFTLADQFAGGERP